MAEGGSINIPELLKYESPAHKRILKALMARYDMSHRAMSQRFPGWKRSDEDFRAYTPESTEDIRRKNRRNAGELQYATVTVPMTYAMALTAHTYWNAVFFNRSPVFQLGVRKGAPEQSVDAMESLLDYQVHVGKMLVPMMIWLMDPCRYGFGVMRTYWTKESKRVAQLIEESRTTDTGLVIPDRTLVRKVTTEMEGYRGNKAYNVRPYQWKPDTRFPLVDYQKGEFCGDESSRSYQSLLGKNYFNLDHLKEAADRRGLPEQMPDAGSSQMQMPDTQAKLDTDDDLDDGGLRHIFSIVINIIPKDWGLGPETNPEKWLFEIGEKKVIINAEPFGHIHDEYPYDVVFYEVEGYALDIRGMMEIGKDMNTTATWLLNSHMFNVRRALNDQLVYDPSLVVTKDITDGGPGKLIRLRPGAYGRDIRSMVHQLPVQDITRSHIADTQLMSELMQRILGVNDNVMGQVNPGGRKTATEVRTASTFSISRLKMIAEFFSATGFGPLCQKMVQNTQQFYFLDNQDKEVFRVVGEMADQFKSVPVSPESIAGFYDYVPIDGTLPIDRLAQANLWKEILMAVLQTGGYNVDEMINWIAQLSGIRGLKRFRLQVLPDEQVNQQRQRGNLVPINRGENVPAG